jgi:hypothetical protein
MGYGSEQYSYSRVARAGHVIDRGKIAPPGNVHFRNEFYDV